MKQTFLDECFKARMDYLQKRFPIESFRRLFRQQYVRNGLVMIQPIVNKDMDGVIIADSEAGFIFNNEHNLDVALRLGDLMSRCDGSTTSARLTLPTSYNCPTIT